MVAFAAVEDNSANKQVEALYLLFLHVDHVWRWPTEPQYLSFLVQLLKEFQIQLTFPLSSSSTPWFRKTERQTLLRRAEGVLCLLGFLLGGRPVQATNGSRQASPKEPHRKGACVPSHNCRNGTSPRVAVKERSETIMKYHNNCTICYWINISGTCFNK